MIFYFGFNILAKQGFNQKEVHSMDEMDFLVEILLIVLSGVMSNRLEQLQNSIGKAPNRIVQYRNAYPLERKQVRDHIYGEKYRKIVDECFNVMVSNKHIFKHGDIEDFDRQQQRRAGAQMVIQYHKLRPTKAVDIEKDYHALSVTAHASYNFQLGFSVRTDITLFLYAKTIINFHRPQSKLHKKFIHNGLTAKDIGCFGLTEIGHGSDTKNMETTATYDHESKTFTLNTPNETGLKFWIGGSAEIANMGLIWAKLIIKGKSYGVHPFVVPLRNRKTMKVYEGVRIGDCGAKLGLHIIDNGYIGFSNYKIPAENILDRVSGVDENGDFKTTQPSLDRRHGLYMGSIGIGRAFIAINAIATCSNALLIGVKYACVRRQFQSPTNKNEEMIIIDYPMVRFRLMPQLATSYLYYIVGSHILQLYSIYHKETLDPKNKLANQLHAVSAAAKAKASWFSTEVIGNIRHFLGGHGYSSYSRLGRMYLDQELNTTWEGDNHMLLQQTVKYVLKNVQKLRGKEDSADLLNFVNHEIALPKAWTKEELLSIDNIQRIFRKRFLDLHDETVNYMIELKGKQMEDMDIWNQFQGYHGKKLSLLFCDLFYISVLKDKISKMANPLREISEQAFRLWTYTTLQKERWNSLQTRSILQEMIKDICDWLAPRSISLVQAIAAPPDIIGSPFADWNGDKMWDKYLGLIYSGKDAFSRVPYYQDIINGRAARK